MSNVLLIIPPGVRSCTAFRQALEQAAASGGTLVGLVLLDPAETARIAATLDSAFMGERVSDRVVEVLVREQRGQAEAILAEVGAAAAARGVTFVPLIEQGEADDVCARVVASQHISSAVLVVERRSWLSRILSRSSGVRLPSMANVALTVIEEEAEAP